MGENETIVLGGGCFWCIEAIFQRVEGVIDVIPGYSGGTIVDPSYEQVCTGSTGHAEVVKVYFDSNVISLEKILRVFFIAHDPTSLDRQGNDIGTQYRSVIFYNSNDQKKIINDVIENIKGDYDRAIVTEVDRLETFYEAEEYHKDYYKNNPNAAYCRFVIKPKLEKVLNL